MNTPLHSVVMATGNKGKLAEINGILQRVGLATRVSILPQSDFDFVPAEETGSTFVENALLKARHAAAATGMIAIADDSGLAVDALNGEPGVLTARYVGADANDAENIKKLLAAMSDVLVKDRGASFHCVGVIAFPDPSRLPLIATGEWRGQIALQESGAGGFGYDPVFFDPELGMCAAEMTVDEKNARSHRGQAFRQIGELLKSL